MKKIKVVLHLLSFIFFTSLLIYVLVIDKEAFIEGFFGFLGAYILFALFPILSLALQYEVSKDRVFFNNFASNTNENLKMNDYLRISFLLFYNLGVYAGVKLRKNVLKKEYRKTDMRHIELVDEIIDRKKSLLALLIIQLLLIALMFVSYFLIK